MQAQHFPNELRTLGELKSQGFRPQVIFDIGASSGIWSEEMLEVCPSARYHLFEPLADHADIYKTDLPGRLALRRNLTLHPIALGETNGTVEMLMFRDAYGSSMLDAGYEVAVDRRVSVPLFRLDDYVEKHGLPLPQVIKIDCQGAELKILRGGLNALRNTQVVFLETWLKRCYGPDTPLLHEVIEMLEGFGFSLMQFGDVFHDEQKRLYSVDAVFYSSALIRQIDLFKVPSYDTDRVQLASRLLRMIGKPELIMEARTPRAAAFDVIVSHAEINNRHGVGVLLARLFPDRSDLLAVRSRQMFGGETSIQKTAELNHGAASGDSVYRNVLRGLGDISVRRLLCVPYYADDVKTAVAAKEVFDAPLCTFLMDDQNIHADEIPDSLMKSLLEKSSLRLAISPDLRDAYQEKYKLPCWFMPPVVPDHLIPNNVVAGPATLDSKNPVMIGNVWGAHWLNRLRLATRHSGIRITWYSNAGFDNLACDRAELEADSILATDPLPDDELVALLRQLSFAIVPSGTLDHDDDRGFLARLSLPSRLIFMMATSHIPILVLGHPDSAVAKFVTRLGLGLVAPYDKDCLLTASRAICDPETNLKIRRRAHAIASKFSDKGAADWIWRSLENGTPYDQRFEEILTLEAAALAS